MSTILHNLAQSVRGMQPDGIFARVPHTRTWPEAYEGVMMPGARFFFYSTSQPFIFPDGR
jgi:hypothetical protein